jgi:hypothetical protein
MAALLAVILVNQKFIRKKEEIPTPSHPIKRVTKSSLTIKTFIKEVKNSKWTKKLRRLGSVAI